MDAHICAESALQLLFKKLHPHLEDGAHALTKGMNAQGLLRLHTRLLRARIASAASLDALAEDASDETLQELLEALAADITPVGETYQQSLILTQLCLEEAPSDLLPFCRSEAVASSSWGSRMEAFLRQTQAPGASAHDRWESVDPDIGDSELED